MLKNSDIFLIHNEKSLTFGEFLEFVKFQAHYIKNFDNIVLSGEDAFVFLVNLFSCIYLKKPITVITDKTKLKYTNGEFVDELSHTAKISELPEIDYNYVINFLTSGTTGEPKVVKKSINNLVAEAETLNKQFCFSNVSEFVTTTTLSHLFGFTFSLMVPIVSARPINTKRVLYPEQLLKKNTALITTPSFLSVMEKYSLLPESMPEFIISAGSKLLENVFEYFETKTNVIEIYGSTEAGVIAHKECSSSDLTLFSNVKICNDKISSPFMYEDEIEVNDNIQVIGSTIKILGRKDRIVKIQEERVSLSETEKLISESEFIEEIYCMKVREKLGAAAVLTDKGREELINSGSVRFTKDLKSFLHNKLRIIPQKWRFIDTIPLTKTGKIDNDYIKTLFDTNLTLPLVIDRSHNTLKLVFHRDSNYFKGHFDGYPIVPGVVQLYYASFYINEIFGLNINSGMLKKIKFSNIIKPDKVITLELQEAEKMIMYKYYDGDILYSSGQLPKN